MQYNASNRYLVYVPYSDDGKIITKSKSGRPMPARGFGLDAKLSELKVSDLLSMIYFPNLDDDHPLTGPIWLRPPRGPGPVSYILREIESLKREISGLKSH